MTNQINPDVALAQLGEAEKQIEALRNRTVQLRYENIVAQREIETLRERIRDLEKAQEPVDAEETEGRTGQEPQKS